MANIIKKVWRNRAESDRVARDKLPEELSDLLAYWLTLCRIAGYDPDDILHLAVDKAARRLGELSK